MGLRFSLRGFVLLLITALLLGAVYTVHAAAEKGTGSSNTAGQAVASGVEENSCQLTDIEAIEAAINNAKENITIFIETAELEQPIYITNDQGITVTFEGDDAVLYAPSSRHIQALGADVTLEYNGVELDGKGTGGGIELEESSLELKNAVVRNAASQGDGGGVAARNSSLTVKNSTFSHNYAAGHGGNIYIEAFQSYLNQGHRPSFYMEDSVVAGGQAATGGGIYAHRVAGVELAGSTIIGGETKEDANRATGDGAGLYTHLYTYGDVVLRDDVKIIGNQAGGNGGGLKSYSKVRLYGDVAIEGNIAGGNGGGIGMTGAGTSGYSLWTDEASRISIRNNSAENGGGFALFHSGQLNGVVELVGNTAKAYGGAIFMDVANSSKVIDLTGTVTISGNTAGYSGGGIHTWSSLEIGGNTSITNNTAGILGGAITLTQYADYAKIHENVVIADNQADAYGGAIYIPGSVLDRLEIGGDVQFTGNRAGKGYLLEEEKDADLHAEKIGATKFSGPFRHGYNNYDISYLSFSSVANGADAALLSDGGKQNLLQDGDSFGLEDVLPQSGHLLTAWNTKGVSVSGFDSGPVEDDVLPPVQGQADMGIELVERNPVYLDVESVAGDGPSSVRQGGAGSTAFHGEFVTIEEEAMPLLGNPMEMFETASESPKPHEHSLRAGVIGVLMLLVATAAIVVKQH